ncbi:ATP-dependent RNA helicase DEAH11, chloroplastic [Psilocybe cubensis]|uniref:ATP-dependent RNA helicase DEAH11, chloroplastic n=2 Tax=Psilocybe cubensis TaxID=181762 RepID=A0ACB8GMP5_PSICU|nr:ATP-dependent RNA helicase DEAH11, chloroplastic [Psilocybe cubensis]KAH9476744.1 ATP-dependent RNA helicase DEAH11, chloroplastic [Psilocybe cubensis]
MSAIHTRSRPSIARDPGPSYSAIDDYEMDYETSALIAQLALQDIEQAYSSRKGKSRFDAGLTDEEMAYQLQLESFQRLLAESEDAKLARSLNAAVCADAAYLEAVMVAEEAANADRRAAQLLSRGERLPKPTAAQARVESRGFVMHPESQRNSMPQPAYEVPVDDYDDDISDTESYIGEFDRMQLEKDVKWKMVESKAKAREWRPKAAPMPNATAGPSVNRNRTCISSLVEYTTRDESMFPLKCCGIKPIPFTEVIPFLSNELIKLYRTKESEFSVPVQERIYCVSATCSTFLGSSADYKKVSHVVCPTCTLRTCPRCKKAAHTDEESCAVNAANIELKVLAVKSGWQTCLGCKRLVEKNQGCNHITCRCGTQFCYTCALKWKTCGCPQ